jgi:hypothetical protein
MTCRQCGEPFDSAAEEWIRRNDEPSCRRLDQGCEHRIEVAVGARMHELELVDPAGWEAFAAAEIKLALDAAARRLQ